MSLSGVVLGLIGGYFGILSGVIIIYRFELDRFFLILTMLSITPSVLIIISTLIGLKYQMVGGIICIIFASFSLFIFLPECYMTKWMELSVILPVIGDAFTIIGALLLIKTHRKINS